MERLTEPGFDFNADFVASHLQSWPIAQAIARLSDYEDSDLTPEEVAALKAEITAIRADLARVTAERDAAKADLLYAMENSDSLMSCEPCTHRGYDPEDGMFCKLKSCRPEWRGPCPENGGTP